MISGVGVLRPIFFPIELSVVLRLGLPEELSVYFGALFSLKTSLHPKP